MRCGRQLTQGAQQPLLHACIRDDVAIAPLEVLRIPRLNQSQACVAAFAGTLRHLVVPELTLRGARKLPAVVAALTLLQVPAGRSPSRLRDLLERDNYGLQWTRSNHGKLCAAANRLKHHLI